METRFCLKDKWYLEPGTPIFDEPHWNVSSSLFGKAGCYTCQIVRAIFGNDVPGLLICVPARILNTVTLIGCNIKLLFEYQFVLFWPNLFHLSVRNLYI